MRGSKWCIYESTVHERVKRVRLLWKIVSYWLFHTMPWYSHPNIPYEFVPRHSVNESVDFQFADKILSLRDASKEHIQVNCTPTQSNKFTKSWKYVEKASILWANKLRLTCYWVIPDTQVLNTQIQAHQRPCTAPFRILWFIHHEGWMQLMVPIMYG